MSRKIIQYEQITRADFKISAEIRLKAQKDLNYSYLALPRFISNPVTVDDDDEEEDNEGVLGVTITLVGKGKAARVEEIKSTIEEAVVVGKVTSVCPVGGSKVL